MLQYRLSKTSSFFSRENQPLLNFCKEKDIHVGSMRKKYLLSELLVSLRASSSDSTKICKNQSKNVWKLKKVLIGKNVRGTFVKSVAKDIAIQGRKKLSVCSYTKNVSSPSHEKSDFYTVVLV